MTNLIGTLKREHAAIVNILVKIDQLGVDSEDGRKSLSAAKTGLLAHLKREDDHLYPPLLEAAKNDDVVKDAFKFFHDDIAIVSKLALQSFDKHENAGPGDSIAEDFATLVGLLAKRIQ